MNSLNNKTSFWLTILMLTLFLVTIACKSFQIGSTESENENIEGELLSSTNLSGTSNNSTSSSSTQEDDSRVDPSSTNQYFQQSGDPTISTEVNQNISPQMLNNLPPEKAEIGFSAPAFDMQTINNEQIDLSQFRGKNILINYWTSWCIPCQEELPMIERFYNEYPSEKLSILTVNGVTQDSIADAQETIDKFGLTFPVMLDQNGSFKQSYLAEFLPTSYFIDSTGIIRYILRGTTSEEKFRELIEGLMSGSLVSQ